MIATCHYGTFQTRRNANAEQPHARGTGVPFNHFRAEFVMTRVAARDCRTIGANVLSIESVESSQPCQ
jgi:hypothetical protein